MAISKSSSSSSSSSDEESSKIISLNLFIYSRSASQSGSVPNKTKTKTKMKTQSGIASSTWGAHNSLRSQVDEKWWGDQRGCATTRLPRIGCPMPSLRPRDDLECREKLVGKSCSCRYF
jgi:hypothetical protein